MEEVAITKRATMRQQREPSRSTPRPPSRERGMQRYELLLDSVDALLRENNPDDIGLYQIAERAGVPTASVYHFFPTKEASFFAVAQRYLRGFAELRHEPIAHQVLWSWQGLLEWDLRRATAYFNNNSPAMKLFLGRYGGLETRRLEMKHNELAAADTFRRLDSVFHMPFLREPEKKFHICREIIDAVQGISYVKHATLTDEYFEQAKRVSLSYCRTFLPEFTELRDTYREAVADGKAVII